MTHRAILATLLLLVSGCGLIGSPAGPQTGPAATPAPTAAEQAPEDCVTPPTSLTTLIEQDHQAACYGSADLTVEARAVLVAGVLDCPGELEPAWLGCAGTNVELYELDQAAQPEFLLVARSPNLGPSLFAVVHPSYDIDLHRGLDAPVTVTGHFDDPEARTCHYTSWPDAHPPSDEEAISACRSRFVITHLELLDLSERDEADDDDQASSDAFAPHDIAQVLTTSLVVRSAPGVGADSEIYDWALDSPTLLYVFDGPVGADGYAWYQVMPSPVDYLPAPYGVGWVAAGSRDGEAWIGPAEPDCPPPTTDEIAALSGLAGLACFGSAPLELDGDLGGCGPRDAAVSPAERWATRCWLSPFDCCPNIVPYPSGVTLWLDSDVAALPSGEAQPSRVVGHFDDPSASDCPDAVPEGADPVPAGWGRFVCRTSIVVTNVAPLVSGEPSS